MKRIGYVLGYGLILAFVGYGFYWLNFSEHLLSAQTLFDKQLDTMVLIESVQVALTGISWLLMAILTAVVMNRFSHK